MTASPRPTRFRGSVELLNWPAARWAIFGLETLGHYNELVGQHQPASAAVMYSMGFTVSDCHERSPRTRVASQPSERGVPRHDRAADRLQDRVARLQSRADRMGARLPAGLRFNPPPPPPPHPHQTEFFLP